jgi:hypothetical protein
MIVQWRYLQVIAEGVPFDGIGVRQFIRLFEKLKVDVEDGVGL